jgi:ribonucleoside-diphosphate reductase alpha chain
MAPKTIRKRDGSEVPFHLEKITNAIAKALATDGRGEPGDAAALAREVAEALEARFPGAVPTVEQAQDLVEETLIRRGLPQTAKGYILYRQRRAEIRQAKKLYGVRDELKLSINAALVLSKRYLRKDKTGQPAETADALFRRVARAVAAAEADHAPDEQSAWEERFYQAMAALDFLPNSPTLMNAGTEVGQLSACFVLPVEDSIEGIFDALRCMAIVHQSGGGTGFSFSDLRPRGDLVRSTMGVASGPLSFMRVFDVTTDVIKQGGRRRGANMGILRCDHPDILEFIHAKQQEGLMDNFNLSVGITDGFMEALARGDSYALRNPRSGAPAGRLRASEVFQMIAAQAWSTGDPGVVFLDQMERKNPTPALGRLEATNPCGEQPLLAWESCNLGSINLRNMVSDGRLDLEKLRRTIALGVRFLDDVIDINRYPLEQTAAITRGNRKIGLGVMGLADALALLGVPYDSERALEVADEIASALQQESHRASAELAATRGPFPNFEKSTHERPIRNATTTSIAPTGTISIIAGCSSGIEPLFAVSFVRNVIEGSRLVETNAHFERVARERGFLSQALLDEVAQRGGLADIEAVPEDVRRLFVTAHEIAPGWHVRMQAAFQRHCDNAVSKTINFGRHATTEQVEQAFRLAHESGCKGITVYRDGSRSHQVLTLGQGPRTVGGEYAGGCPASRCDF